MDGAALYATILAHPHEDTPRLAFADFVQEHVHEEWGQFIRVQCELALMPDFNPRWQRTTGPLPPEAVAWMQRREELRKRERELWGANWNRWSGHLGPFDPFSCADGCGTNYAHYGADGHLVYITTYRARGFAAKCECVAADWLAYGDVIVTEHPITDVRLTTAPVGKGWPRKTRVPLADPSAGVRYARWPGVTFKLPVRIPT